MNKEINLKQGENAMSLNIVEQRIAEAIHHVCGAAVDIPEAKAEEIVAQCGIKGLTADMVRQGKTPHDIARLWLHARLQGQATAMVMEPHGSQASFPLLPYSQIVFDSMQQGNADAWTFQVTFRAESKELDAAKLHQAIETAINHHPVFRCRIDEKGMQNMEKEYRTPYLNYELTEKEEYIYMSFSINRILGDATSFILLFDDINRVYNDEPLHPDNYLNYLEKQATHRQSAEYAEHGRTLHQQLDNLNCPVRPTTDHPLDADIESFQSELTEDYTALATDLALVEHNSHLSLNATITLATALAIMDYNHTDQAALTWAYAGRENEAEQHIFGSLHRDIPFVLSRKPNAGQPSTDSSSRAYLIRAAREQMQQGVVLSDYPYTFQPTSRARWKNAVNVLLQPTFIPRLAGTVWEPCQVNPLHEHAGSESKNRQEAYCLLDIEICPSPLMLTFKYSSAHYTPSSIQRFAELVRRNVEWIAGRSE